MTGRQLLRQWIDRRGYKQVEAAAVLGFHESFISAILSGARSVGLHNAAHIEELTGIPIKAWASSRRDNGRDLVGAGADNRRHIKR